MNLVDTALLGYVNQFAQHSMFFDKTMVFLANNHLVKSALVMLALWHFWFKPGAAQEQNRRYVMATVVSAFTGLFMARALALLLPFRLRPIHEESLHFVTPLGMSEQSLHGWSSFPSDHAVLYFSLSAGVLFLSARWGILLMLYTALCVAFPRLYLGLHYPSDLVAGMAFGLANTWLTLRHAANARWVGSIVGSAQRAPQVFYPLAALLSFQIMEMFDSVRMLAGAFFKNLLH